MTEAVVRGLKRGGRREKEQAWGLGRIVVVVLLFFLERDSRPFSGKAKELSAE